MNKNAFIAIAMTIGFACAEVTAQQKTEKNYQLNEVVISNTKFSLPKEKSGKVIAKISQSQIRENTGKSVSQLLNDLVGVEINGAYSNQGANRGTFIRGGRSRQVLVLIDGVPVTDPTGVNQEYDFRLLSLDQIESIEVLKGASSSLYGSGAATGVINIILKKANKKTIAGNYTLNLGTNNSSQSNNGRFNEVNQHVKLNGTANKLSYLTALNYSKSSGLSAAKSQQSGIFYEEDDFKGLNGMLKVEFRPSSKITIQSTLNYDSFMYDYDDGAYVDSDQNSGKNEQLRLSLKPEFTYKKGKAYILASFNQIERDLNSSHYEGNSFQLDAVNKFEFSGSFHFISGVNFQTHRNQTETPYGSFSSDLANFSNVDVYVTAVYSPTNRITINAGGRLNMHSNYGNNTVYHINPSFLIFSSKTNTLKIISSYSTAFIAPSLYQLFSSYGNLNLIPEINKTFEIGFDGSYGDWLEYNSVFFNRVEDHPIVFNSLSAAPWGQYGNATSTIHVTGIETFVSIKPLNSLSMSIGYTFTDKDFENDYIPKHKITANLRVQAFRTAFFTINYRRLGGRTARYYDTNLFKTVEKDLPRYQVFDFSINYTPFNTNLTLFANLSNVFNEDYEETIGYSTRGRNYSLGLRFQF